MDTLITREEKKTNLLPIKLGHQFQTQNFAQYWLTRTQTLFYETKQYLQKKNLKFKKERKIRKF